MSKTVDVVTECNHLVEAYLGYYEDEIAHLEDKKGWVHRKILADSPKERLEVYCHWNGIIGYSNTLYEIATMAVIAL